MAGAQRVKATGHALKGACANAAAGDCHRLVQAAARDDVCRLLPTSFSQARSLPRPHLDADLQEQDRDQAAKQLP